MALDLRNKKIFVTGGAGFIGSNLCDELVKYGEVTVLDNLSAGKIEFLKDSMKTGRLVFIEGDVGDEVLLRRAMEGHDVVFHLRANPDVRVGVKGSEIQFRENVQNTFKVLEAMKTLPHKNIVFASTSTVYGLASVIPTPEDYGPIAPISIYGGSKAACEALITSYACTFDFHNTFIFRFANIIGKRSTHGVIVDFIDKLRRNPHRMEVLGDGRQRKSYLYISDCIDAMLHAIAHSTERIEHEYIGIYNIGSEDSVDVLTIAKIVAEEMGLNEVEFTCTHPSMGGGGWKGDVPRMGLSIDKIMSLGWKPKYTSLEAVRKTVRDLLKK